MDPASGAVNGDGANGQANGPWPPNNAMVLPIRPRLPTVDDALQFSPLSSITPFDPSIIPFPSSFPHTNHTIFTHTEERQKARRGLDSLNAEAASNTQSTSYRLQQSLQQLQQLLRPSELTEFKFKRPAQGPSAVNNSTGTSQKAPTPRLGAFSAMVLNKTNVAFRYPTPTSPTKKTKTPSKRPDGHQSRQQEQTPRRPVPVSQSQTPQATPQPARQNVPLTTPVKTERSDADAPQQNDLSSSQSTKVAVVIPPKSSQPKPVQSSVNVMPQPKVEVRPQLVVEARPQPRVEDTQAPPSSQERRVGAGIVVLKLPSALQKIEYQAHPDVDARILACEDGLSRKRKREDDVVPTMSIDQRQRIEATVMRLQNLIGDIFEAEDQLQPDTSGNISSDAARFFVPSNVGDNDLPVLSSDAQSRLDSALHKVISAKAFGNIPADSLSRLQKLCEGAVSSVSSLSITLGEDWSEGDIEEWVGRLNRAQHGLQAARILLRIMTAGREEKQLYSEDILSSILDALKHVLETCMIPVFEARNSETNNASFKIISAQRGHLNSLLQMAGKVLRLLAEMIVKVDVSDSAVTSVEFVSTTLIFVENAPTEKDSALGIQKCEGMRRIAMDVLAKIFARYPDQRTFIFDEILTSLEKLPVTRQSARQFKMLNGKPIQLVSALLMRLIQTSATRSIKDTHKDVQGLRLDELEDDENASQNGARSPAPDQSGIIEMHDAAQMDREDLIEELNSVMKPLFEDAQKSARYLVNFMVQRAMTATKTGDQPYRNLLDIFTEDFLTVLGSSDWPAAELLLRALLSNMIGLAENDKSPAPAKNMALDLMGLMGSGILDLQLHVKSAVKSIDTAESELSRQLANTAEDILDDNSKDADLLEFDGPYRVVLEYLESRDLDDPQLQSAQGYHVTQWAKEVHGYLDKDEDENMRGTLAIQLRNMMLDPKWLEQEFDFTKVSTAQGILAGSIVALRLPFCKAFKRMFAILLSAMTSDQATVKSRSLKSVVQLLEKDPSILKNGHYIIHQILRCASDQSPLVRDSALGLLAKCLQFKPSLENEVFDRIIARAHDAAVGVRKRAMKLLRDIYLRNESKDVKTAIAEAFLQRIKDVDDGVSELARTTFEEIWFTPFHATNKMERAQSKFLLQNQVVLIIRTVQRGETVLSVLDALLENVLSPGSKNSTANFNVCKSMVAVMFDGVIDSTELPENPSQQHILQTLTVFARANPKLFTGDQLQLLQPYIQNLSNTDDLLIYRSVIVIFRHTLPSLSSLQNTFLKAVQDALLASVSKLGKMELNEVAQCLWIIDGVLQNTERLVRLTISVINGVYASKDTNFTDDTPQAAQAQNRVKRYMMIAGYFGKCCNFDPHTAAFKEKFPWWKGSSVAGLIVDVIRPFTRQKLPHNLREMAFESIGMICQAWPFHFLRTDVTTAFELVFHNRDTKLEQIVLSAFKTFFAKQEAKSESGAQIKVGEGVTRGSERLEVSLIASDDDGACSGIAQRFLHHIVRIALEPAEEPAMIAAQVIASINRQGLVHPKECGPALVALETSTNQFIANLAFQEHKTLHQKHESMFEKEYMKACHQAFEYQQSIFHDTHGATTHPFAPKLRSLFEVLKTGNSKVRKKFLLNLASKADFDFSKLDTSEDVPPHLLYSRFCLENLAFFDYVRVDELLSLVSNMEKIVSNTGTPVAHAIELEVLKVRLDEPAAPPPVATSIEAFAPMLQQSFDNSTEPFPSLLAQQPIQQSFLNGETQNKSLDVAPERLKHLTIASIVLTMIWETRTYLRRLWGLQKQREGGKTGNKPTIKDLNKAPSRQPFIVPDKFWEKMLALMDCLSSTEAMVAQCKAFAELLSIDNELRVASEDDEEAELVARAAGYDTPDDEDESRGGSQTPGGAGPRGRKRKGSMGSSGTPKKKRGRLSGKPKMAKGRRGSRGSSGSHDEEAVV
ncbi:sister chromatid cohesion protein mis4 [Diplodia corticola]|uniref:Sister chromatid cohesion protein n=1 Tax=Diplodia corticola TaxID=236234 RepID=A0A1J9R0D4_9PEZI|nr:sister chromatid cohesion protein mis4 [Diplodia corticola]OJD34830.1 sister chromatid cohesion protein mis4 [Diplodia corticola]